MFFKLIYSHFSTCPHCKNTGLLKVNIFDTGGIAVKFVVKTPDIFLTFFTVTNVTVSLTFRVFRVTIFNGHNGQSQATSCSKVHSNQTLKSFENPFFTHHAMVCLMLLLAFFCFSRNARMHLHWYEGGAVVQVEGRIWLAKLHIPK